MRAAARDRGEIADEVEAILAGAIDAWPAVAVDPDRFVRAVVERLPPGPIQAALAELRLADLYLVCGCLDGDPAALAAFEARLGPVIRKAIAASGVPPIEREDVAQIVRQRLLVGDAEAGRLATYSARGWLDGFVRVVALREAARIIPRVRREPLADEDELDRLVGSEDDPELAFLKKRYREELKRAFEAAVAALDDRARLVLRQHLLDGLGIDQLASLHHVHRSTAARWIEAARATVVSQTQRELFRQLKISRSEVASLARLVASQLDMSLPRILG